MIKLDQFLKFIGITSTGGQAKLLILDGEVKVNGIVETRRGRKLGDDDLVTIGGQTFKVGKLYHVLSIDFCICHFTTFSYSKTFSFI